MLASYFSKIFGSSPFRPLQEHMMLVASCASELIPYFEAVTAKDYDAAKKHYKTIAKLENDADELKQQIRIHLPKGVFMPVSRSDLLELLKSQDAIANIARDIAGLMLGRKILIPDEISEQIIGYVERSIDACKHACKVIDELDELLETGFRGMEVKLVKSIIEELHDIESDADKKERKVRSSLFKLENNLPPVEVIFLYKIIDDIGQIADKSQQVGSRLEIMLAR
ncbi:MAG: TIGR00153 family protein [Gammaproteobacteria bacterium]|nr:TIGR00153 family protein [Gammaproteobacteria bacterium]